MKESQTIQPTEAELLGEILRQQKKLLRASRLRLLLVFIFVLAAVISAAILVPKALSLIGHIDSALDEVDVILQDAEELTKAVTPALTEGTAALEKINSLDFEKLNEAIRDLADTVKPLGDLSRVFGGGQGD